MATAVSPTTLILEDSVLVTPQIYVRVQSKKKPKLTKTERGILNANGAKAPWTVEAVVAEIPGGPPVADSSSPVPFFHMLERLKTTKREGWRRFGIAQYVMLFLTLNLFSKLTMSQRRIDLRSHVPHVSHHHVRTSLSILEAQHPPLHEDGTHTRHG
jgi:hypothetical protein